MQKKQLPPVSIVKEDGSEFYATTADVFHVLHLYFTQKVNSKKKVVGFCLLKPNLIKEKQYDKLLQTNFCPLPEGS